MDLQLVYLVMSTARETMRDRFSVCENIYFDTRVSTWRHLYILEPHRTDARTDGHHQKPVIPDIGESLFGWTMW